MYKGKYLTYVTYRWLNKIYKNYLILLNSHKKEEEKKYGSSINHITGI